MSGHSHWATVKRGKEIEDKKRGKIFSKLTRIISLAAKEGGKDPQANAKLQAAILKAKEANMPRDNIDRAIKKGAGELAGEAMQFEEVIFEALGPAGVAVIITGITDNKNRTLGEIKQILARNNAKLAGEGAVKWQFERKGVISAASENLDKEGVELAAIEAGADDIKWQDGGVEIYTMPEDLEKVKRALEGKGVKTGESAIEWVPKEAVEADEKTKEQCERLFEALDDNDAVQDIYSNIK